MEPLKKLIDTKTIEDLSDLKGHVAKLIDDSQTAVMQFLKEHLEKTVELHLCVLIHF